MIVNVTTGEIINGTIGTVRENGNLAIAYIAVLSFIGLLLEWGLRMLGGIFASDMNVPEWVASYLGVSAGLGGLLFLVIAVIANYLLWEVMLQQSGLVREGGRRFFRFIGQAILIGFATAIGFVFLIVPGLILGARWAAAPAFLIGEKRGAIESMGESWEMVRGNTTPVVLAFLVGVVAFLVLASIVTGIGWAIGGIEGPVSIFLQQVVSNLGTVFSVALGVFLYRRMSGAAQQVAEVFE